MAPASTGRDSKRRKAVINNDHRNMFIRSNFKERGRMLIIVVIKLIAPKILLTPAIWSLKIAKSTPYVEWNNLDLKGGYTVQPVPTPPSLNDLDTSRINDGGNNQNLKLFIRGKAISTHPTNIGINQFPNPPTITGITKKKIITKACLVTTTLYN